MPEPGRDDDEDGDISVPLAIPCTSQIRRAAMLEAAEVKVKNVKI